MASAEIAFVYGLKVRVGYQDRLCVNSDADETLVQWESRYVQKCYLTVVKKSLKFQICYVTSELLTVIFSTVCYTLNLTIC